MVVSPGYGRLIVEHAQKHQISPKLIAAIIHQESKGNPWAVRREHQFFLKYLQYKTEQTIGGYVPQLCTFQTEKMLRSYSFGLMQIMGQTARENGFEGEYLTQLCDPATNIEVGVKLIKKFVDSTKDIHAALLRYNGGGDEEYPAKILKHIESGAADYVLL